MSGSPFGIGEYLSAQEQSEAMGEAADTQAAATRYGIDTMYKMWEQAQQDFAPYLAAGGQGLSTLTSSMPQYMNQVLQPLAQQIAGYQLSNLPSASTGMVNPVTGEVTQYSAAPAGQQTTNYSLQAMAQAQARPTTPRYQAQGSGVMPQQPVTITPQQTTAAQGKQLSAPSAGSYKEVQVENPAYAGWSDIDKYDLSPQARYTTQQQWVPNPEYEQALAAYIAQQPSTSQQQESAQPLAYNQAGLGSLIPSNQLSGIQATSMPQAGATLEQLAQGGVLSPLVPTLNKPLDYTFNEEDQTYQILLKQKNQEIDRFLSRQGLSGSSAGESFRQQELDKLRAEQDATQYNRALTERNYGTQTTMDQYGLEASRGETLYGRQYQSGQDLYNKALSTATTTDTRNLAQLQNVYNLGTGLYGLQYGGALDLSKMGAGAASSAGAGSIQTGQGISNASEAGGAAAAQGILGQSNIWANYMQGLTQQGSNVGSSLMNYFGNQNTSGGGYYGGYGTSGGWNPYGGSSGMQYSGATGSTMGMY